MPDASTSIARWIKAQPEFPDRLYASVHGLRYDRPQGFDLGSTRVLDDSGEARQQATGTQGIEAVPEQSGPHSGETGPPDGETPASPIQGERVDESSTNPPASFDSFVSTRSPPQVPGPRINFNEPPGTTLTTNSAAPIEGSLRSEKRARGRKDVSKSDSEGEKKALAGKKQKKSELGEQQRFPCSFYQRDPEKHQRYISCWAGRGFPNVHRLKQHLYKYHMKPDVIQCCRCQKTFDNESELTGHYRAEDQLQCPRVEAPVVEGITTKQRAALKKPSPKGQDEIQKWRDVWSILFPEDTEIPYPHMDRRPGHVRRPESSSSLSFRVQESLTQLESFIISKEAPRHFETCLQQLDADSELRLSDSQKSGVKDLLPHVFIELSREFKNSTNLCGTENMVAKERVSKNDQPKLAANEDPAYKDAARFGTSEQPSGSQGHPALLYSYDPAAGTINPAAFSASESQAASVYGPDLSASRALWRTGATEAGEPMFPIDLIPTPVAPSVTDRFNFATRAGSFAVGDHGDFTGESHELEDMADH